MRRHLIRGWIVMTSLALLLQSCGGDGSSSMGKVNLSLTDAPVDDAVGVVITVANATLEGVQGATDQGPFPVNVQFDLMSYQGTDSRVLLMDVGVEEGAYKVRLDVDLGFDTANPEMQKSYIVFAPGADQCPTEGSLPAGVSRDLTDGTCRYPLRIPSGGEAGFRPKGNLAVTANHTSSFTVEFDLRKNMVDPSDAAIEYVLKPTGLRLVNDDTAGTLRGDVDGGFFGEVCESSTARVYLYDLANTPGEFAPDDIHDGNDVYVTSVAVEEVPGDPTPTYRYVIGFIEPGSSYAVALTCDPDDPGLNDVLTYVVGATDIAIGASSTTVQDLKPPPNSIPQ